MGSVLHSLAVFLFLTGRPHSCPPSFPPASVPVPQPQDIRNQRRHRQRRKAELLKLQATVQGLNTKTTFFEEQGDYYSQYIRACLGHLAPSSK